MQANVFAIFVLATYPLFVAALFAAYRPPAATGLSFLIAQMVLPPGYNLPLPFATWLGKDSIPSISCLLAALVFGRSYLRRSAPFRGIERFFLLAMAANLCTILTNEDPLRYGRAFVQGETPRDFFSESIRFAVYCWAPFYLGRVMFKTSRDLRTLARMLVLAAAIYTVPILIELRMSPQFNQWFYGYATFQVFGMAIRWGGYRPQVLMGNGIVLSMFMLTCTLMAVGSARAKARLGAIPIRPLCAFLVVMLISCKSTGSVVYALIFLPLLIFASPRRSLTAAGVLAAVVLIYPSLRFGGLLPVDKVGSLFDGLSADRAQSVSYRFNMEQGMLDLMRNRPWFGMGGYGRNFLYNPVTGKPDSVIDGAVIADLSTRGLIGFLMFFGPFVFSVLQASRRARRIQLESDRVLITALTLACAIILFDLILNATLPGIFIMMLGALNGLVPGILAEEEQRQRLPNAASNPALDPRLFEAEAFPGSP
jgi:hypothetical protein